MEKIMSCFGIIYRGWLLSLVVAKICRCRSVRLGRCGLFYVEHIRLCLIGGIVIEVDDFRVTVSFFNTHYTKPFIITISDIRIEGECNQLSLTPTYKKQCCHKDFRRYLHWLQYTSTVIRTARVVFLGVTPGSLLHSTFQQLQLDGYRDREGMQIELSCKLLQAKLFSRGTTQNTAPLLVLSLGLSVCCNIPLDILKLKRLGARITDPQLILSDGLLEYFHDHSIRKKTKTTSDQFFTSFNIESLLNTSLKLDIENLVLRYTANMDYSEMRTVAARLNVASLSTEDNQQFAIVLTGINVDDQTRETLFSCNEFDATLNRASDSPGILLADMKIFNPHFVTNQKAIVEWTGYYRNIGQRISTSVEGHFDDDFSAASTGKLSITAGSKIWISVENKIFKAFSNLHVNLFLDLHVVPTEMKTFCWESLYVEVNSFHCRLLLSNGQEINASLELGTFRVNDNFASAEIGLESVWIRQGNLFIGHLDSPFCHVWGTILIVGALLIQYSRNNEMRRLLVKLVECQIEYEEELIRQMASFLSSLLYSGTSSAACNTSSAFQPYPPPQVVSAAQISVENVAIFILARHSLYLILSIEQLRLDVLPSSTTLSMLALNFKILQGIMTNDEFICWDDSAQIKSEHIVGFSIPLLFHFNLWNIKCGYSDRLMMRLSWLLSSWEWVLLAESTVNLVWSTTVHIIFLETFRSLKQIWDLFGRNTSSKAF
ncbi:unnamed protein product, partial [Brugia timori]|uniref:Fmp27_GFWDK domain-containing protein n=2 Tax=Brugia TaxID=6278 RepID=A0A0R3Q3Z6_9BILA